MSTDDPDGICLNCYVESQPCTSYGSPKPMGCADDVNYYYDIIIIIIILIIITIIIILIIIIIILIILIIIIVRITIMIIIIMIIIIIIFIMVKEMFSFILTIFYSRVGKHLLMQDGRFGF